MTPDAILAINAGSSSLKFALFSPASGDLSVELRGKVARGDAQTDLVVSDSYGKCVAARILQGEFSHATAIAAIVELLAVRDRLGAIGAVGHRVVHGGGRFVAPTRLDAGVRSALTEFLDLAPLHMPSALAGMAAIDLHLPGIMQFACFYTAFHATLPEIST